MQGRLKAEYCPEMSTMSIPNQPYHKIPCISSRLNASLLNWLGERESPLHREKNPFTKDAHALINTKRKKQFYPAGHTNWLWVLLARILE